jgi:hypothetical protein
MNQVARRRLLARLATATGAHRHRDVIAICDEILRDDPQSILTLAMRATAEEAAGRIREAALSWHLVLEFEPNNFHALRKLTDLHRGAGAPTLARTYATRAVKASANVRLAGGSLRFLRLIDLLFGASTNTTTNDIAAVAMEDETRIRADDERWIDNARAFIAVRPIHQSSEVDCVGSVRVNEEA